MAKISTYPLEGNPKLSDKLIGTSVGLNQVGNLENPTYNFSLQQLLDLFSPLLPGNNLQGVLDNNNTATQDINLFGQITTTDLEVTNVSTLFSVYISDSLYLEGKLFDVNNSEGTAGQILTSTGDGVEWITPTNVIPTLQEVLTSGNEADVDIILTADITAKLITANDILVQDSFELSGTFLDSNGLAGTSGQMLISSGTGVQWQNVPVYTASSPLFINPATRNITIQQANGTQNGYLSFADWITFDGKQNALSGTGIVVSNGGIISYIANNSTNWNQAYNDTIISAAVTGTSTKTLTLTQRDGDTITASWSDSGGGGGISSIGLTMPAAFTVTNSPLTADGTIAVSAAGDASQYIKGDGTLGTLPSTATFVPYTGATANVNLGIYNITANSIIKNGGTSSQFLKANGSIDSTSYFPTPTGTTSQYVRGDGSLATFPSIANEAQRLVTEVYNKTGATLTKGTIVYINGGQGNLPSVTKALATSDATSAQTYGVVQNDITNNNNGYVVVVGSLLNLDTQAYPDGTQLYLSGTTAGAWTSVKPQAPIHLVYVGIVVRSHPTQGVVEVKIQNGYELDELHDVYINPATLANGDLLQYNSSNDLWENKSLSAAGIQPTLPTFTNGSVIFSNGTTLAQDNANFFWDDTNNRLNIGGSTGTSKLNVKGATYQLYLESTDQTTSILSVGGAMIAYEDFNQQWLAFNGSFQYIISGSSFYLNNILINDVSNSVIFGARNLPNATSFSNASNETLIGVFDNLGNTYETGFYAKRRIYCSASNTTTILTIAEPNSSIDLVVKIGYGTRFFIAKVSVMVDWDALTYTYKITNTNTTDYDDSDSVNINFEFAFSGAEFVVQINNTSGNDIYPNINANIL